MATVICGLRMVTPTLAEMRQMSVGEETMADPQENSGRTSASSPCMAVYLAECFYTTKSTAPPRNIHNRGRFYSNFFVIPAPNCSVPLLSIGPHDLPAIRV